MKKIAIVLMVIAATAIIGGTVVAGKPRYQQCESSIQYYKADDVYLQESYTGIYEPVEKSIQVYP